MWRLCPRQVHDLIICVSRGVYDDTEECVIFDSAIDELGKIYFKTPN